MESKNVIEILEEKYKAEIYSIKSAYACHAVLAIIGSPVDDLEYLLEINSTARFGISGLIYCDDSNRFKDETYVHTSIIKSFTMLSDKIAIVKTRNTTYLVYMWSPKEL